jgi:hypothetical protein
MALSFYVIVSFLITLQRYVFLLYIQKNEIKIAPQLTIFYNVLRLRQTGTKKAPKKHISSVLFIAHSFGYLTKNH